MNHPINAPRQLSLTLPEVPADYARSNYLVTEANAAAFQMAMGWRESGDPALVICGEEKSGKTHLAHILAEDAGGRFAKLGSPLADAGASEGAVILIDDVDAIEDPKTMLGVIEDLRGLGARVLLIGRGVPGEWAKGLRDLATRLESMARVTLVQPDEALMRQVLAKAFSDRQMIVEEAVILYAVPRLSRTFAAAHAFAEVANRASLEEKRPISIALARKILNNLFEGAQGA